MKPRSLILKRSYLITLIMFISASFTACGSKESTDQAENLSAPPDTAIIDTQNPSTDGAKTEPTEPPVPPAPVGRTYVTDVMLFNGIGISTSDWQSTEKIIKSAKLTYQLINSSQLDAMSLDKMATFGVMFFPGGVGTTITRGVSAATAIRVRQAVRDRGVNFVGICAGAWIAVGQEAITNNKASYGFAVVKGNHLPGYYPGGKLPEASMEDVKFADGSHRKLVWWGGPSTPNWTNGVVAKYVTGEPAISQAWSGKGFVIVTGPHPEAPQGWRATAGFDSDGLDFVLALDIIKAALYQKPMAVF